MDCSGLSEDELKAKLEAAESYEERSAIRKQLRELKKERGTAAVTTKPTKGNASYKRFGGGDAQPRSRAVTISVTSSVTRAKQKQQDADPPPPIKSSDDTAIKPANISEPIPSQSNPAPVKDNKENMSPKVLSPTPREEMMSPTDQPDYGSRVAREPAKPKGTTASSSTVQFGKTPEQKPEFQGFKLRKTGLSVKDKGRGRSTKSAATVNPDSHLVGFREQRSHTVHVRSPDPPKPVVANSTCTRRSEKSPLSPIPSSADNIQPFLVAFVNKALTLDPPLPSAGRPFYTTCSQPDIICSLINYAVPNTVDMRALSSNSELGAHEDNMTLALESARAIGCRISDDSDASISHGEPQALRQLVLDIVRAHAVHLPSMEDESAETFDDPLRLFRVLGLCTNDTSDGPTSPNCNEQHQQPPAVTSPTPVASKVDYSDMASLSYEERAARRRAEREQRRKQMEAAS